MRWVISALLFVPLGAASPAQARERCAEDDALARAASDLLLEARDGEVRPRSMIRAVRRAGSDVPTVHALRVPAAEGSERVRGWLERLQSRADAPLACGEAQGMGVRLVLAGARAGHLRSIPGSPAAWRVELERGFRDPRAVLRDGHGELAYVAPADPVVRVPDEMARPVRVQLVADGPVGPRPVAERWLGDTRHGESPVPGDRPPPSPDPEETSSDTPAAGPDVGRRVAALRHRHGVLPLRPNRLLASEAQRHAKRVCDGAPVGHELEAGADPEARLGARGIEARVVGEVVARAPDPALALEGLADSPSHRMTLVDRRFTDGGWGRALDADGRVCLVVLLAAWPRAVPRVTVAGGP